MSLDPTSRAPWPDMSLIRTLERLSDALAALPRKDDSAKAATAFEKTAAHLAALIGPSAAPGIRAGAGREAAANAAPSRAEARGAEARDPEARGIEARGATERYLESIAKSSAETLAELRSLRHWLEQSGRRSGVEVGL